MIWGPSKRKGYKCKFCSKTIHHDCFHRVQFDCMSAGQPKTTESTDTMSPFLTSMIESPVNIDSPHRLLKKKSWSFHRCSQSKEIIWPLQPIQRCETCSKNYKSVTTPQHDCGLSEKLIYDTLSDIRKKQHEKIKTNEKNRRESLDTGVLGNTPKYGSLLHNEINAQNNSTHLQKSDSLNKIEQASFEALANASPQLLTKIGISDADKKSIGISRRNTMDRVKRSPLFKFSLLNTLGRGNYGHVILAKYKSGKKLLAIKAIRKDVILETNDLEAIILESEILKLNSRFLVKAAVIFQDPRFVYFGMELCPGGDLMTMLCQKGKVKVENVRVYMAQVLFGLQFMHSKGVIHRDVKPDNILIDELGHCKITDFGMARAGISENSLADTFCGTPEYVPPEILWGKPYGFPVDVWSTGVSFFIMVEAKQPFNTFQDNERTFISIKFNPMNPCSVPLAHDLFENLMLVKEPLERANIDTVFSHRLFSDSSISPSLEQIRNFQFEPVFTPDNKPEVFLSNNFDGEFTSMSCDIGADADVRMIGGEEDKVFSGDKFNWINQEIHKSYVFSGNK